MPIKSKEEIISHLKDIPVSEVGTGGHKKINKSCGIEVKNFLRRVLSELDRMNTDTIELSLDRFNIIGIKPDEVLDTLNSCSEANIFDINRTDDKLRMKLIYKPIQTGAYHKYTPLKSYIKYRQDENNIEQYDYA